MNYQQDQAPGPQRAGKAQQDRHGMYRKYRTHPAALLRKRGMELDQRGEDENLHHRVNHPVMQHTGAP